jgi:hypothetical protein
VKSFGQFCEHVDDWMDNRPDGTVPHGHKKSPHKYVDVERHWHDDHTKFHKQSVPIEKIHATQGWHHPGYKPKYSRFSEVPHGIRTKDGNVHISDGHHRMLHAKRAGKTHFDMHVKDVDE